jgi:drug/metabolite transporter (DMT)-like permease
MNYYYLALLAFAVLSAVRDVAANRMFQHSHLDPVVLTWVFCLATAWCFYLVASVRAGRLYTFGDLRSRPADVKRKLVQLNISTMLAYVTTFAAISLIDAYSNSLIDYGATPIATAAMAVVVRGERLSFWAKWGMVLSVAGIVLLTNGLTSSDPGATHPHLLGGLILALVSCGFASWNNVLNKELVVAGLGREQLIVSRLVLAVVVLGVYALVRGVGADFPWLQALGLGTLGIAVPLYLVVYAFERVEVRHLAVAFFLVPVITYALSVATNVVRLDIRYVAAGCIVVVGVYLAEIGDRVRVHSQSRITKGGSAF